MKKLKSVILVGAVTLIIACMGAALAACSSEMQYNAYLFLAYEDNALPERQERAITLTKDNMTVQAPSNEMGFEFSGWYLDKNYTEKYDPSTYILKKDFNLYGLYVKKVYTVNFVVNDEIVETQKVKYKDCANEPTVEITGYRVVNWNNAQGVSFDVRYNKIIGDMTLYANIEKREYLIYPYISVTNYISPIRMSYGDNIKDALIKIQEGYTNIIPEGWYFDEKFTEPVDLDTYTVSDHVDVYLKFRYDIETIFELVKLNDGTYGIPNLANIRWYTKVFVNDGIAYIPDSFINRNNEECIISTLMTDASTYYNNNYKYPVVFGKNTVNIEENAIGTDGTQQVNIYFFSAEYSQMNIATNYIKEKSKDYIVTYFGEEIKHNSDFIYTDTGNDIVILYYLGNIPDSGLVIPRTIDGKPVTKINRLAINTKPYMPDNCKIYLSSNIRIIQSGAFYKHITFYCEFSESDTPLFASDWHGNEGVTVLYNQTFPNTETGVNLASKLFVMATAKDKKSKMA